MRSSMPIGSAANAEFIPFSAAAADASATAVRDAESSYTVKRCLLMFERVENWLWINTQANRRDDHRADC
jgi:hypothetical protein